MAFQSGVNNNSTYVGQQKKNRYILIRIYEKCDWTLQILAFKNLWRFDQYFIFAPNLCLYLRAAAVEREVRGQG